MRQFENFVAVDWSGQAIERPGGIALAIANAAGGPPVVAGKPGNWSRADVLEILRSELPSGSLVGFDFGIALPFADCDAYFPGWDESPTDAPKLWALIDRICDDDPHLSATSFVRHSVASRYFRHGKDDEGDLFHKQEAQTLEGRFRVAETAQRDNGVRPVSNFNLVGAAQVGKSSLTGMRMLNRLHGEIPVWPIDDLPESGSVIVEIYTSLAALEAGRPAGRAKMRSYEDLNSALVNLGSPPVEGSGPIDDHSADALLTAAWLRKVASDPARWNPSALTPRIARTEGWTFGAT